MSQNTDPYPQVRVDAAPVAAVGQAGGVLLTKTATATGLTSAVSSALASWRKPFARHDPGKILLDLAVTLALGGGRARAPDPVARFGFLGPEPAVGSRIRLIWGWVVVSGVGGTGKPG